VNIPSHNLTSLFASRPSSADIDLNLAARYAPILRFDAREPFLPLAVAYSIFRKNTISSSFPRRIELSKVEKPGPELAIEYAIWWDWDIVHLFELEHIWVFLDKKGHVVRGEASWHSSCHNMGANGGLPLTDERLTLFSEPGKHAFAPMVGWLLDKTEETLLLCRQMAGTGGLLITPLFKELTNLKTAEVDRLVYTCLQHHAFEPSFEFSCSFSISADILVPWPALYKWIPERLGWLIDSLKQTLLLV
jgi:putative hydrolase of the HAD superfamily